MSKKITFTEDENGCFVVTSHRYSGYCYPTCKRNGKEMRISHLVYEECFGPIPKGLFVLHKCDNPGCINPAHLKLGTHKDNMQDMINRHRHKNHWGNKKFTFYYKKYIRQYYAEFSRQGIQLNITDLAKELDLHPCTLYDIIRSQKIRHRPQKLTIEQINEIKHYDLSTIKRSALGTQSKIKFLAFKFNTSPERIRFIRYSW